MPDIADLVLRGATVMTMNRDRKIFDPGLVVIKDGRIDRVEEDIGQKVPAESTRTLSRRIVLPGFVNTHAHLVSVLVRGLGLDRFQTGVDRRGRELATTIREGLDADLSYLGARLALAELMASGVTTTTDSQTARRGLEDGSDGTLKALTESGLRSVWYRASVDTTEILPNHRHDTPALAQSELDRLHGEWGSGLVSVGAEALSLHRVTRPMLDALREWSESRSAPFAMHVAYSKTAAAYAMETYGSPLLNVLESAGVLNDRFLGHHPVHMEPVEIETAATSGAGFSWSPAANMLIGLSAAPVDDLRRAGVRIGLGTDQPNDGHNLFEAMKSGILQQRADARSTDFGSPEEMLELATIGGARALHMENDIGSIEAGKQADLVVINANSPMLNPQLGRVSNLVYTATPSVVDVVFVGGSQVFAHDEPVAWNTDSVVDELNHSLSKLVGQGQRNGVPASDANA